MCPRFWPLTPPQGMDPGVRSHGMKADPPGYLWSKYECFLLSGWWDILHLSCFNVKLWSNSPNVTKLWTNEHTERWKLYTHWHKCQVYNFPLSNTHKYPISVSLSDSQLFPSATKNTVRCRGHNKYVQQTHIELSLAFSWLNTTKISCKT